MPCTECTTHGRECITDELSDKRRKASAKKTQDELADTQAYLNQLLEFLRDGDPAAVDHLLLNLRNGADFDTVRAYITQARANQQSSTQPPIQSSHHSHHGINPNLMDPNMRNFYDPNSR